MKGEHYTIGDAVVILGLAVIGLISGGFSDDDI